ncbi:MAG TPA: helix-hairpin-helix domain-containing protein, partial [Ilumatobacteraceae bacterium]
SGGLSILLVAAGCWWLLRAPAPPVEARLPLTAGATTESSTSPAAASSTTTATSIGPPGAAVSDTIVVQAAGAVAAPGVYSLPAGARVHELISAAGGVTAEGDPAAISLAVVLVDGQRVYVPLIGEIVPAAPALPPTAAGAGAAAATGPIDLNRATAEQLDALPGVGPATAAAIVAHRDGNGPFASVEDLLDVRGIGPAKLDGLRDLVTV